MAADGYEWLQRLITKAGTPGFGSYDARGWVTRRPPLSPSELTRLLDRIDRVRVAEPVRIALAVADRGLRHGRADNQVDAAHPVEQ